MVFNCLFLCNWKWIPSTTFSGNDGFFDLTHVGTGERLNVQESWANKHPRNDGCVVAYLGEHKLSDLLWIIHIKEKLSKSCILEKPINDSLYNLDCDKTNSMHKWDRFVHFQEVGRSQLGTHDEALLWRSFTWPRLHDKHLHDVTIAWHMIAWQACAWNTFEWQKYRKHDGTKPWHTLTGRRITFTWRHKYMNVTHVTPKNNYMTYDYMT